MATIEEDFDYIISTLVDHDCPFEARAALTRIRADRGHLEQGSVALAEILESWSKRAPAAMTATSKAWLKTERARQSRKDGE